MEGIALECRDRLVIHQPKGNSCQIAPAFTVKLYSDPRTRTDSFMTRCSRKADSNSRSHSREKLYRVLAALDHLSAKACVKPRPRLLVAGLHRRILVYILSKCRRIRDCNAHRL